nr:hypothetical protein HK105_007140 [Polyrhizophydium stewartii]
MALPQFVDESMREVLQDLGVWTNDARMPARYLDVAQDSSFSMVLLLSVSPREAVRGIVALSETYEESHLQLSIVNEADKQGDRWIQKIKFAAENDAWVLIVIDSFWIGLLDKIHQLSKMPSSGFKIWIVGMTSLSYRLPLWLFSDAHCICDEEDLDSWLVLHKLQRNEAHIDELFRPWLATLLKFHFGLVSLMRRSETAFPDFMSFDDIDLKLSLRAYATAIRRKLPLETLKRVLLDAIYAPEARSPQDYERLASLWSEAVRTFDASVAANGMPLEKMSRDNFVSFLAQSRPFMFTPKNLRVHRSGNAVDIDAISLDLCRKLALILDAIQPAAAQLASDRMIKHKIGQYLNTLPTTINLRLIYENMNSPESHQTKCFLLEEANNFLRLLRRVRMNLRVLLTSFSNGYPTASARKTLDAVTNNKVLQSWVRRAHPTSATLDMWMDDIGRRIKFLDKWIMLGQPWLIHAGLPFSLRALLQGLRQIFASKAQAGISTVELIFEQIDLAELDRRKIADLSARYGIAAVLAGFHMEGVRMVDGKVEALDAGKPDSLPLFMVRPQYLKDPAPYRGSLIPVSTHLLDSDVYVCSSSDAENERRFLFQHVFPGLLNDMAYRHIDLHFVDLKYNPAGGGTEAVAVDPASHLQAALTNIKRAALFVGIFGSKLGPLLHRRDLPPHIFAAHTPLTSLIEKPKTMAELEVEYALTQDDNRYIHKGLRSCMFYFRDPNFARSVPKSFRAQYEPEDVEEKVRLDQLRMSMLRRFPDRCVPHYPGYFTRVVGREVQMGGLEKLGERVRNDLIMAILEFVKQRRRGSSGAALGSQDSDSFSGRESITRPIIEAVCSSGTPFVQEKRSTLSSAILIYGASGMGKTALLSHLCHEFPKRDVVVLYNFVRSWAGSFNVDSMIQRFCIKLFAQLRIQSHRLPTESVKLKEYFVALLNEVVFYGNKVAVIIDGIDRMVNSQGQRDDLWWLPPPSELGSEVCSSISWIMSAADDQIMPRLQSKYKDATKIPLLALTDDDKRKIIADRGKALRLRVDARSVNYLLDQKASESPLYLRVVLKEAQQSMSNGHFVFEDYHLETTWLVFEQVFERIERKHGVEIIRLFFSLLSFARNGLREMELVGLLKLDLAAWNLLFESIEDYIIKTSTGYVIVFHEQFTAAIRRRYLRLPSESERFHHLLASYYISICDPAGDLSWLGNNEIRAADISFHQLRAKRPISEIARIMCSIGYVSAVFTSNLAHELPGYFSEAVKLAVDSENSADRSRLTDYSFFVERYSHNLATYPKLAYSLALSLPNGFCMYVREEALESYKKQATREPFLNCLSLAEDQLEMVPLGAHMTEIIYVGVIVVGALGKCCVSVSSDATVKCWNIDTFLFVKTLLAASIGADSATECCFSLNHSELVAFGTRNSHICVFTTETGMPFSRIENVYTGGPLFFSEDAGGVWQRGPHKSLQFVHFASGRTLDATGNAMDDANGVITGNGLPPRASTALMPAIKGGKVASVVARSMDGHKIALLTIDKRRHIAVLSAKTMREICRFVEDGASDASRGQFSIGKDLLAVVLAGGDIMIWKIDTHSRVALVRMPSDIKVSCISVSIDESMLYFGSTSSTLGVASTKSGHIFKRLWIGEKTVLSQMCIATSKGKERFFLAAGTRLSTCDSHSSLRMETGGTQKQHVELSIPLRHSAPINAVLPFSKRQQNGVEAISVSRDGRLVSWAVSDSLKKLAPVHEVFVAEDLTSCRLSQTTGFAVVTAGTSAIIWNVHEAEEVLRISHKHALRDAILVKNRIDDTGLTLYTWMIDGQLSAWKIMGRASMFLTYDPTPLFQRFITVLPSRPQMSSRREFLVANDFTVIVLDSETGQELRRFETRGHETVLGLSWHHMPGEVPRVMYVTKTTLFVDGEIWSYGGSLGDMMQLDSCKRDRTGTYVGYSGVQLGESFVGKTSLEKRIIGVVVVLAASAGQRRHRVCMLKHDNARVVQWDFLHDPSFIVTIATDLMVRVWDIRGPPHAIRAMSASDIGRPIDIWTHAGLDGAASSENARDTARDSEEQGGAELKGDGTEDRDQRAKSAQLGSTVSYRRRLTIAQQALMIGTQIDGIVGHVCAMFPLRSPCTCLQVANDDYVLYTGNEQGDVLQFRLEFAMTDDLQRRPSRK